MKRKAPFDEENRLAKRALVSSRYPGLRAPPRRTPSRLFLTVIKIGSSSFERLPAEIRNLIYELVLVDKARPLKVRHQRDPDRDHNVMHHALTQVSRSIRAECLEMYYSANTFKFRSLQDLWLYVRTIDPECRFLKKTELFEGVIEGRHFPHGTRDKTGKPATRINFTYRISKGDTPVFAADSNIQPAMRQQALARLDPIGKFMMVRVQNELIIEGLVPHCEMCAAGWNWSCGMINWWER